MEERARLVRHGLGEVGRADKGRREEPTVAKWVADFDQSHWTQENKGLI